MRGLAIWVAVAAWITSAGALFEEQAGQVDWYKQNIGRVTHAEFAFRGRERVFVATASDVVASLDTRDGSIAWRQALEPGDGIDALALVPRPACVLTLSRHGSLLRAWHALDGALLWERRLADPPPPQHPVGGIDSPSRGPGPLLLVLPDVTGDGTSEVAVVAGSRLQVMSGPTGKLVWTGTVSGSIVAASHGLAEGRPALIIGVAESSGVLVRRYDAKSGEQISVQPLAAGADEIRLSAKAAAALGSDRLCGVLFDHGGSAQCEWLMRLTPSLNGPPRLGDFVGDGTVLPVLKDDGTSLVRFDGGVSLVAIHKGYNVAAGAESSAALARTLPDGRLQAVAAAVADWRSASEHTFPAQLRDDEGGPVAVRKLVLGTRKVGDYNRPEATLHRMLVVAADDSLHFLEGDLHVWRREEALAAVRGTLFVDLPAEALDGGGGAPRARPTLMDRVMAELLTIKGTLGFIQPAERQQLKELNSRLSTHLLPHRDANGFRKLIVALTASGKLFGLHSGDGRVQWQLTLAGVGADARLFPWRTSHDAHSAPEVMILVPGVEAASFLVVNAHTGRLVGKGSLQVPWWQVVHLPETLKDGPSEQHVFALVSRTLDVAILPSSAEARGLAAQQALHFWVADEPRGVVSGFRVPSGGGAAEQQWSLAFSGPSETILHVAARDPGEHVYSYAKVLGDRSLKLKYLNPNAILVISGPPDGAFSSALGEAILTASLVDTVSGQILYRQSLEGARGPVAAALSENWAVYAYHSLAAGRAELAVLEFYDVQTRDLSIPSLLFGEQNGSRSPFAPAPLEVLHQSYFLPRGIKTMAATATRRGIASKQLLLGTDSNQVYLMDKRFVDPRRPKGAISAEEKAEMLLPYTEELPFVPQLYASHREVVEGLRGIATSPANLESTALTLSYGLDLFFTRVQPSKTFDLLPDDFPYAALLAVTGALAVGAAVLKRMEDASSLKRKWQ